MLFRVDVSNTSGPVVVGNTTFFSSLGLPYLHN
jgi:hypothetical protein